MDKTNNNYLYTYPSSQRPDPLQYTPTTIKLPSVHPSGHIPSSGSQWSNSTNTKSAQSSTGNNTSSGEHSSSAQSTGRDGMGQSSGYEADNSSSYESSSSSSD
ncbi:hypothetical protein BJX70DRAFT_378860 [Aspergillus crustosus]